MSVLTLADIAFDDAAALLARFDLKLEPVAEAAPIPGSYWGDPEAGIVGNTVHARADTPVHSLLHEAAHLIVLPPERRAAVHTDATDSIEEEDAVLVLQALLADALPGVGREPASSPTWTHGVTPSASAPPAPMSSTTPTAHGNGWPNAAWSTWPRAPCACLDALATGPVRN